MLRHWLQFRQLRTWIHDNHCYLNNDINTWLIYDWFMADTDTFEEWGRKIVKDKVKRPPARSLVCNNRSESSRIAHTALSGGIWGKFPVAWDSVWDSSPYEWREIQIVADPWASTLHLTPYKQSHCCMFAQLHQTCIISISNTNIKILYQTFTRKNAWSQVNYFFTTKCKKIFLVGKNG